jgi:concentrative nucleoside transporter, CNT family
VPWDEAAQAGTYIGEKTVLNEFVAYADFGPNVKNLSHQTVVVVTFALAGFANFASIAIQIGSIWGPALLAGSLVNLANAAIAGVVAT